MQGGNGLLEPRQIPAGQHAAGGIVVEEGIAGMAVGELHEGKGGRPVPGLDVAQVHLAGLETLAQHVAEEIGGQSGEEACPDAQPAQRDGRVVDRATIEGLIERGAILARPGQEVDQGFATAENHPKASQNIFDFSMLMPHFSTQGNKSIAVELSP